MCCVAWLRCDCQTFEQAVAMNNGVPQGLSSSLFTKNMQDVFKWMGCVCVRGCVACECTRVCMCVRGCIACKCA
jgi:hypothetical protein